MNPVIHQAALFSAVNSGFLALSLPNLSNDPSAETNTLLRLLVQGADNSTLTPADLVPPPFNPSHTSLITNQLFSSSLTLSLLASFGALLAQQWIVQYTRPTPGSSDGGRWDRERKFFGAQRWGFQTVVEMILPIILQGALFVFIVGFIIFLHDLCKPVALPNLILTIVGLSAFTISTLVSAWDPFCPFQTPFTTITRFIAHYGLWPLISTVLFILGQSLRLLGRYARAIWLFIGSARPRRRAFYEHSPLARPSDIFFDIRHWIREKAQREKEKTEVVHGRAVRRFIETSGRVQLLKATAANLPLPFNNVDVNKPFYTPPSERHFHRLISLHELASRRGNKEEESVYARAVVHVLLMEEGPRPDDVSIHIFNCAAHAYLDNPQGTFHYTTSAIATVLQHYLDTSGRSPPEKAREYVDFLCLSALRHPQPLPMTGALLGVISVFRALWKSTTPSAVLLNFQERYGCRDLIERRAGGKIWVHKNGAARLVKAAIHQ